MIVTVHEDGNLSLQLPDGHYMHELAKALPKRRWLPARKLWVFPPLISIMETVRKYMPGVTWSPEAEEKYKEVVAEELERKLLATGKIVVDFNLLDGVQFKKPPREAQKRALLLGRDKDAFAYLMDQGTGKTKVVLDDAAHNYRLGRIDCLVVLAPNSVKTNWCNPYEVKDDETTWDQITTHMAPDIPYIKAAWFPNPHKEAKQKLKEFGEAYKSPALLIFVINVDGVVSEKAQRYIYKLCQLRKVMIVVDESTRIGNHASTRSKVALKARKMSKLARIMSGTPVIKSPLKAFSQFLFLDYNILGYATFTEFKAHHAVINPNNEHHILRYRNTEELSDKIAGASFRVLKKDCLDLDPKTWSKRLVEMTAEQTHHYKNMREEFITYLEHRAQEHNVTASNVMVQMARLQQITAGYLPVINDENVQIAVKKIGGAVPPKIAEAAAIVEECDHKLIIWCKYRFEVFEMAQAMQRAEVEHVTFFGDTKEHDRISHRQRFLSDPGLKVFIGQISTGGIGLDLYTANTCIYLSNTFSTEDRLQSEDRAHRHGNVGGVEYIDLVSPKTVDERVLAVLRANKQLSDQIMKDGFNQWL